MQNTRNQIKRNSFYVFLVSRIAALYWITAFTISDTTYLYIYIYYIPIDVQSF